MKVTDSLLTVEGLKVHFETENDPVRVLEGVNYDVRRGETVCLVGESGCGKTVSALAILGLIPSPPGIVAAGRVVFDGEDLLKLQEEELQRIRGNRIAMVFQEPLTSLNPVFTIGHQIEEVILVHEAVDKAELRRRTLQQLKDVGIPSPEARISDYPHQLSGGQRQRVMIAMALACNPDLLIADEPTTALDVTIQAQILDLFRAIQEERSLSLLYITHDLGVVAHIADRIYVMYAGVVVEQGDRIRIFRMPCHPYTEGLLASLPTRSKRGARLYSIPGSVPDPTQRPQGCPFHPRCRYVRPECKEKFPGMCDYGGGHLARCPVLFEEKRNV